MMVCRFFARHEALVTRIRHGDTRYIVVGAGGWIGRAFTEYLAGVLGEAASARLVVLGSSARTLQTDEAGAVRVHTLAAGAAALPAYAGPSVIIHCAFVTMDKVSAMTPAQYVERNVLIRDQVAALARAISPQGIAVLSSGAVYDFIAPRAGRPAEANLYGRLKFEDECFFAGVAHVLDAAYVCPRIFNLSGPYINKPGTYALASFIQDALAQRPLNIRANFPVMRAYLPVQTLVESVLLLLDAHRSIGTFDFAGEQALEVGELARLVTEQAASPAGIVRPVFDAQIHPDRYVGNADGIKALMAEWGLIERDIKAQVADTMNCLRHFQAATA
jgi:UDP-glucuronate decarboxylase